MKQITSSRAITGSIYILPASLLLSFLTPSPCTAARDLTIAGGISSGYEWLDREYDIDDASSANANEDDDSSRFRIAPLIEIQSLSARDEILLHYSPSYRYDIDTSTDDVDHDFSADYNRFITQRWRMLLGDRYRLTDEADDITAMDPVGDVQISDDQGRRQYWTNDLSLSSEYTYWEDSLFTLGYTYTIYENTDSGPETDGENYDRHSFLASVGHRFDSIWKLSGSGNYIRGLYDESDTAMGGTGTGSGGIDNDLTEYGAGTTLEWSKIMHHVHSLGYSFSATEYDDSTRDGSTIHNGTLGWQWAVAEDLSINLGGGPSYAESDGQSGQWGYNANLGVQKEIDRGSFRLAVTHGFDQQNFDGTDENGLQEFSQLRADFNYQLLENVSLGLFSSYRYEDLDTITPALPNGETTVETINKETTSAGTNLSYQFQQWYSLALSYSYTEMDSEQINDSYDEHQVALTLSYKKDLFHW
jgi:hypothetical protein